MFWQIWQWLSQMLFMALHTLTPGSFPRPLSAERERACLEAYHRHGDMAARNELVEHNLRLVAHIIKKYYSAARDQEELISIGTIGLIKAVSTFDGSKGIRLATYASRCIENEILMHFRAGKKTAQDVSISEPIDTDKDGHPLELLDVIAAEDTICEDLERKVGVEQLGGFLQQLPAREREILLWRYGLNGRELTQREVAKKLHISRSYVSRIEKKALLTLRRLYETSGHGTDEKKS